MDTSRYSMKIAWSGEDECLVVTFQEFPNLSAFGETYEEAVADAQIVLRMALESLHDAGIPAPEPQCHQGQEYSGQVRLRMPKSMHRELAVFAEVDGVSMNTYILTTLAKGQAISKVSRRLEKRIETLAEKAGKSKVLVIERNLGEKSVKTERLRSTFGVRKGELPETSKRETVCLNT